jgi:hypothetical protein
MGFNLSPSVEVGGAASISTILIVDMEVQSFPPYIFVPIPLRKDTTKTIIGSFN